MAVNAETMARLKACELEMLKAFIDVCDRLGLKYYLVEGTLLGAVRHKGFIPWDDDIDVGMLRTDYDRFLKEAQQYLPEYYFVQSIHSEPEYHANFAKIRDNRTTFVESSVKKRKINHGVYIDIFPIDYVPAEKRLRKLIKIKDLIYGLRIAQVFTLPFSAPQKKRSLLKRVAKKIVIAYVNCRYSKIKQVVMAREKMYTAMKTSKLVTNYGSAYGDREIMPKEWYGEGISLEFEGVSVRVPTEYDKWLTQVYGNYMQLPPVEKRIAHHFTEVIDLEKPYTEYVNK